MADDQRGQAVAVVAGSRAVHARTLPATGSTDNTDSTVRSSIADAITIWRGATLRGGAGRGEQVAVPEPPSAARGGAAVRGHHATIPRRQWRGDVRRQADQETFGHLEECASLMGRARGAEIAVLVVDDGASGRVGEGGKVNQVHAVEFAETRIGHEQIEGDGVHARAGGLKRGAGLDPGTPGDHLRKATTERDIRAHDEDARRAGGIIHE